MTSLEIKRYDISPGNISASKKNSASDINTFKGKDEPTEREIPIVIMNKTNSVSNTSASSVTDSSSSNVNNGLTSKSNTNAASSIAPATNSSLYLTNDEYEAEKNMQFNKYGFLEPISVSATNSLVRSSKKNSKASRENLDSQSLKSGANSFNGSQDYKNMTMKELIQNTPVDFFTEQIPIDVIKNREIKWLEMLDNYEDWMANRFSKLRERCRKGIPQSIRSRAWMYLTGACILKAKEPNKDYYAQCLRNTSVDAKCLDEIKRDLHRQFPNHEIFRNGVGIQSLYNVLHAYAAHNPEVGYCQSQGPIAAVLVMYMPEEDAFWMLVRISDLYLKDYFKPDLEKIQIDGHTLFNLFKSINPTAYKLMQRQSIHPTIYMTEWFMCIFARTLPWCTVLRVWDMFFCEGIKVLFRVGLYLLKCIFANKQKVQDCAKMSDLDQQYALYSMLKDVDIQYLKENVLVKESLKISIDENTFKTVYQKAITEFKNSAQYRRKQK